MSNSGLNLSTLFDSALQNVASHRDQINRLDGHNGNHGDNMVHNLQVIAQALGAQSGHPPSDQLRHAAGQLAADGRGGTSQYYAQGLNQAAERFQGQDGLNQSDITTLLQSMMGSVPAKPGAPSSAAPMPGGDLGALMGMLGGDVPQTPQPAGGADPLSALLGGMLGGAAQPAAPQTGADVLSALLGMTQSQPPAAPQGEPSVDMGDLLTAGLAFMQAKQQGADTMQAAMQAVTSALMNNQVNPLQASSPQAAAGGLIAQSLLQAALGQK